MRVIVAAASLLLLAGCVTTEPVYLANGMRVVRIACSLRSDALTPCYRTAGNICGSRGFIIYDWNGQPWPKPYPVPDTLDYVGTLDVTSLLVACQS